MDRPSRRSSPPFILWTAFGSVFALLLGYSRIPYAAALDGTFFRVFGRVHAQKRFPHVSLLVLAARYPRSAIPLDIVIASLITTRILVQFVGQIAVLSALRRTQPDSAAPLPHVALSAAGTDRARRLGLRLRHFRQRGHRLRSGDAGAGVIAYLLWQRRSRVAEAAS